MIDFQDIMRNTAGFEEALRKMHFSSGDNKDRKLSHYVDNVEVHFASKKRNELLVKARSILKDFSYADPPVSLLYCFSDSLIMLQQFQQCTCQMSKALFFCSLCLFVDVAKKLVGFSSGLGSFKVSVNFGSWVPTISQFCWINFLLWSLYVLVIRVWVSRIMGSCLSFLGIMSDSDEIDLKSRLSHFLFGHDQVTYQVELGFVSGQSAWWLLGFSSVSSELLCS